MRKRNGILWEATTLEWTAPSPPPHGNWGAALPTVHRWPYEYSVPGAEDDYTPQTVLAAVHGVHLLAGVLALLYAFNRVWRLRWTPSEPGAFHQCATYWHFVDGAWLYLFFLLFAW